MTVESIVASELNALVILIGVIIGGLTAYANYRVRRLIEKLRSEKPELGESFLPKDSAGRLRPVLNEEANIAVRNLTHEANTFLALAFAAYSPQLALLASSRASVLPLWTLSSLLFISDLLVMVFALATMARFDLAGNIGRVYNPWPRARLVAEQTGLDHAPGPGGGVANWWFDLEDAFFRRGRPKAGGMTIRVVAYLMWQISPARQYIAVTVALLALILTNWLLFSGR